MTVRRAVAYAAVCLRGRVRARAQGRRHPRSNRQEPTMTSRWTADGDDTLVLDTYSYDPLRFTYEHLSEITESEFKSLVALVRDHAAVTRERDELRAERDHALSLVRDMEHLEVERDRLSDEVKRLGMMLDEAQLRSIEARNPGIDMDEVRRLRAEQVTTRQQCCPEHTP